MSNSIAIGARVKLVKDVDNYPTIYAKAGLTGILTDIDREGCYWVRLDQHFPELNEWENQLAIWDWSTELGNGPDCHPSTFISEEA